MEKPVALFDLDGTLADFPWAMERALKKLAAPGEQAYYEEQEDEPAHITARRRMIKYVPGFWRDLPVFRLGFDILDACNYIGFSINVLTKAPKTNYQAWAEKAEWCTKNIKVDHTVTMSEDKGLVYGKVLVDDWPKYVNRWLEHRPRGLVIMPAQKYNERFEHSNVIRYTGENIQQVLAALYKKKEEFEKTLAMGKFI